MDIVAMLERFLQMDRRFVFLGMAIAILLPMLYPVRVPFEVDERVQSLYDEIEALPPDSTVLISADFGPTSRPELEPFFRASLDHLFRKDVKIVGLTLWEYAPGLVVPMLEEHAERHGKEYGTDWVWLGYKPGKELAIKAIGENIPQVFPTDYKGTATDSLPIMKGYRQARDFAMVLSVSAGFPGTKEYVLQIQGQYSLKLGSACTAVSGPDYIPFYKAGQIFGLSAGMPGSAQYEKLVYGDNPPPEVRLLATQAVDVLNLGHVYVVVLIVLGNIAFFLTRKREE